MLKFKALSNYRFYEKNYYIYIIKLVTFLTRILIPEYFRLKIKCVRFSKELMLLYLAYK
jgi:hypothetical protein